MSSTIHEVREQTARTRRRPGSDGYGAPLASSECQDIEPGLVGLEPQSYDPAPPAQIPEDTPHLLGKALLIRSTEEKLLELFSQGQICGTVHTCVGQEWIGVAVAAHLQPGDYVFSNHRGHGHYLAFTDDVEGLVAELMGRQTGVCGGRGGSQHLCRDGFFSNGIQGGIVPVAAGLAMAQKLSNTEGIAAVFIGDGTLGEGVCYETLNIAARWSLPLLIVVEDNGIAQSTEQKETLAGSIGGRAEAFGLAWASIGTNKPEELLKTASEAVHYVRSARRPFLLHVQTQRLNPHSKGDDTRCPQVIAELRSRDPLNRLLAASNSEIPHLLAGIDHRLEQAVRVAAEAPPLVLENELPGKSNPTPFWQELTFAPQRMNEAIRNALGEALERDPRLILLGEDICDPYGGAFKVTAGLSRRFSDRVYNTPISEAAIVGIGNGLALAGWHPVVEIMFGDFITLAFDQILNHAAKFAWMYNGAASVPLIIRTPMGGYRGYGPTHSQSLEKHLLGIPGTRVLALTHRYCPEQMYRTLLESNDRPTLVVENKLLYSRRTDCTPPPGTRLMLDDAPFPTVRMRPDGDCQLTVMAYGGMVPLVESAIQQLADHEDLACDLLIPTQLYPFDPRPVRESVERTGHLLVVEEGQGFSGFASEVIAQIATHPSSAQLGRCARVCAEPSPIPAARAAEQQALPSVERIVETARGLFLT